MSTCTNKTDKIKPRQHTSVYWQYIGFEFNDTIIGVFHIEDSMELRTGEKDIQKYYVSKPVKDSLFEQATAFLDFNEQPKWFCTDYAGNLKVKVAYNKQLVKEARFSSICDWRRIGVKSDGMDRLLKEITKSR